METATEEEELLMRKNLILPVFCLAISLNGSSAFANESALKKENTIAIIGNSELPKIEVVLPWRVASNKDATKIELTPVKMADALKQTDIIEHRERVYFERYIKVSTESFTN